MLCFVTWLSYSLRARKMAPQQQTKKIQTPHAQHKGYLFSLLKKKPLFTTHILSKQRCPLNHWGNRNFVVPVAFRSWFGWGQRMAAIGPFFSERMSTLRFQEAVARRAERPSLDGDASARVGERRVHPVRGSGNLGGRSRVEARADLLHAWSNASQRAYPVG